MRQRPAAGPPHWWPANEPWPPPGGSPWRRHGRRRFIGRVAIGFAVLLALSGVGANTLILALLDRVGVSAAPQLGSVLLVAALSLTVLLAAFLLLMRRVGLPLGDVVGASERVSSGDFSVRLAEHGPPSLRSVARAFNSMTTRLEENERRRQQFMSDVAHELRTPLAILQGRLEGILDGVYQPSDEQIKALVAEARTLARLVDDLRSLANAEAGDLSLRKEPTDVAILLHETASGFNGQAGVEVRVDAERLMIAEIDPVRIREVVANLLANAVQHSRPGRVVAVRASAAGGRLTIAVQDQGDGIPIERLPFVFDRFYKDPASAGSGLGLSIARTLVRAHGGEIVADSEPGIGTTITVTLPAGANAT